MSQSIPTTQALADDEVAQIDAQVEQSTPLLAKAYTRVAAKVHAGVHVLLYKYGGWIALQMHVSTASMRETTILGRKLRPLVEWGRLLGVGDPLPATRAELTIAFIVQSTSSTPLPAGSQVVNPRSGVVYTTVAPLDVSTLGTHLATIRAASDQTGGNGAGAQGNATVGAELQFANPLPYVSRNVTITAQTVTGADEESEPAYRARVVRRAQRKPQGGAYADYAEWGEEDPGIVQVFPYRGDPGQVDVYVEATEDSSGSPDGIPTSAQLDTVKDLIELNVAGKATRRPVNAAVNTLPISRSPFDVVVTGLTIDDEASTETAIEEAVDEYFRSREPYITGLSVLPRLDRVTQAAVSGIVDEVASSLGGSVAQVQLRFAGETIPAYTLGEGEKAKLGAITFL